MEGRMATYAQQQNTKKTNFKNEEREYYAIDLLTLSPPSPPCKDRILAYDAAFCANDKQNREEWEMWQSTLQSGVWRWGDWDGCPGRHLDPTRSTKLQIRPLYPTARMVITTMASGPF